MTTMTRGERLIVQAVQEGLLGADDGTRLCAELGARGGRFASATGLLREHGLAREVVSDLSVRVPDEELPPRASARLARPEPAATPVDPAPANEAPADGQAEEPWDPYSPPQAHLERLGRRPSQPRNRPAEPPQGISVWPLMVGFVVDVGFTFVTMVGMAFVWLGPRIAGGVDPQFATRDMVNDRGYLLASTVLGLAGTMLGGWICALLAGRGREVRHGVVLGLSLTAFGVLWLLLTIDPMKVNLALTALSLLLTPPAAILGAWVRAQRTSAQPAT